MSALHLQRYAVLLQCLFQGAGNPHPLVRSVWALANDFRTKLPFSLDSHQNLSREHPDAFINSPSASSDTSRSLSLSTYKGLRLPLQALLKLMMHLVFSNLVQDLHWGTFHVSRNWIALPPHYALLAFLPSTSVPSGGRRQGGSDTTGSMSGSSDRSSVSTLTAPSATAPAADLQTRVLNPTQDSEFMALELKPRLGNLCACTALQPAVTGGTLCLLVGEGSLLFSVQPSILPRSFCLTY
jgi:hypothetical protein